MIMSSSRKCLLLLLLVLTGCTSLWAQYPDGRKSIVRTGRPVHITKDMRVQSAVSIGNSVVIDGRVSQDAVAIGGTVTVNPGGLVSGSAVSVGGVVNEKPGSVVRGDVVEIAGGFSDAFGPGFKKSWWGIATAFRILMFIGFTALALLVAAILPRQLQSVSSAIGDKPLKSFLWGMLVLVLVVPVAVVLLVSIIGIVLIPVEIAAVVFAAVFGYIAVGRIVGHRFALAIRKPDSPMIWEVLIGLVILWLTGLIPLAGGLVRLVVTIFGFGGVVEAATRWHSGRRLEHDQKTEPGKNEVKV